MTLISTHEAIRKREPFTSGGLIGVNSRLERHNGILEGSELLAWYAQHPLINYVVVSLSTPIAWHTPHGWHVVEQESVSGRRHQRIVRQALDGR